MSSYSLFSVIGIEIEYMLVDKDTLNVQPKSDLIIHALAGKQANEAVLDEIAVSNELVMHVLELKNNGPKPPDSAIANQFQSTIKLLQPLLNQHNLQLLPTGAHPWMNPATETKRWPYGNDQIYRLYDQIFDCRGHGWSNLQSMHVNLPFANDQEFCYLHNAIRLILPLLPALAASSPILDGQSTGYKDARLVYYGKNQQLIPSISGAIIPEFIRSEAEYQQTILKPMYRAISAYDPNGILQHEWLNSRAAIAKFDYQAIEIRIVDTQECVNADIAIAKAIVAILQYWQEHSDYFLTNPCGTQRLKTAYDQAIVQGLSLPVEDKELMRQWQLSKPASTIRHVWTQLIEKVSTSLDKATQQALETILNHGSLSDRILLAANHDYSKSKLQEIYHGLGQCLQTNQQFLPK